MRHRLAGRFALRGRDAALGVAVDDRVYAARTRLRKYGYATTLESRLNRLEAEVIAAEDLSALKRLQRAYGYYLDKGMWEDLQAFFTDDADANYPRRRVRRPREPPQAPLPECGRSQWRDRAGQQPAVRPHEHSASRSPRSRRQDGEGPLARVRDVRQPRRRRHVGGRRLRASVPRRSTASGRSASSIITRDSARRMRRGGWRLRQTGRCAVLAPLQSRRSTPATSSASIAPTRTSVRACRRRIPASRLVLLALAVNSPIPTRNLATPLATASPSGTRLDTTDTTVACSDQGQKGDPKKRAADLAHRASLLKAEQDVENLQRIYGYYIDRAMWIRPPTCSPTTRHSSRVSRACTSASSASALTSARWARTASSKAGSTITSSCSQSSTLPPTARPRACAVASSAMTGKIGEKGYWSEGIYENTFVNDNGVWKFASLHFYPTFITDYDKGWGQDAQPVPAALDAAAAGSPADGKVRDLPEAARPAVPLPEPGDGQGTHAIRQKRTVAPRSSSRPRRWHRARCATRRRR